ncbi:hypothetical protein ACET3Z_002284 [Daucus carota]
MVGVSELENVNIKLRGTNGDEPLTSLEEFKLYFSRVVYMFPGLSNAKILTLDSATVQALSAVSKLLVQVPSPFYQLNHVKVPQGHKDSSISTDLKRYLLGRSPEATTVTKLPQDNSASMSCQSIVNKLGKGGYGDVYKGTLKNGDIVAVKRIALDTRVAETIFDSEVRLISNVHHRNLIRLLGCCIKGQELLLVIEYMANSSLERFLYVSSRPPMSQVVAMLLIGNTSEEPKLPTRSMPAESHNKIKDSTSMSNGFSIATVTSTSFTRR